MYLKKSRICRGNVLVLTVLLLTAISIVAAGTTAYFLHRNALENKINERSTIERKLYAQFNEIYIKLLDNEEAFNDMTIHEHLLSLIDNESITLSINDYNNKFTKNYTSINDVNYTYEVGYAGYQLSAQLDYDLLTETYSYSEVMFK